jgi:putative transposase
MSENEQDTNKAPRRRKAEVANGRGISQEVLDELLKDYQGPEDITGPDGLLKRLTAALVNRAMEAEMGHHLGYDSGETPPEEQGNRRNGKGSKRVRTGQGEVELSVPRDRDGTFEPQIVPKHQRHFNGFDDKILAMYARGMSVRDIREHLEDIYAVDVSPDLISRVTDSVVDELRAWQNRPLEAVYCIVYLDALVVKVRDKGGVRNKSVYVAVGVPPEGTKDVLGLWVQDTEGAKFWCAILEQLRQRGVQDILVLCTDGLSGMAEAAEAIFPEAVFQTCIVHVVRSSTRFVPWKDRKPVCTDLRKIYTATTVEDAEQALEAFEAKWDTRYPTVARSWRARWADITPFLDYPAELRKAIYTTNAIEALNRNLRKALKTRGHMPNDEAALKLLYLALRHGRKTWGGRHREWSRALNQFAIFFEGRLPQ